jgi:hypothetical protein
VLNTAHCISRRCYEGADKQNPLLSPVEKIPTEFVYASGGPEFREKKINSRVKSTGVAEFIGVSQI